MGTQIEKRRTLKTRTKAVEGNGSEDEKNLKL